MGFDLRDERRGQDHRAAPGVGLRWSDNEPAVPELLSLLNDGDRVVEQVNPPSAEPEQLAPGGGR